MSNSKSPAQALLPGWIQGRHKEKKVGLDLKKKWFPYCLHHLLVKVDISSLSSFPLPFVWKLKVLDGNSPGYFV